MTTFYDRLCSVRAMLCWCLHEARDAAERADFADALALIEAKLASFTPTPPAEDPRHERLKLRIPDE